MKHRHYSILVAMSCLIALSLPTIASAQTDAHFDHEYFHPLPSQGTNILNTAKSDILPSLKVSAGLFASYERLPVKLNYPLNGSVGTSSLLETQVRAELSVGLGLFDYVELGLSMPIVAYQMGHQLDPKNTGTGSDKKGFGQGEPLDSWGLGDLKVIPKVRILKAEDFAGFGLGLTGTLYLPIPSPTKRDYNTFWNGKGDDYLSSLRGSVHLIADYTFDFGLVLALNAGYDFRSTKPVQFGKNYIPVNTFDLKFGTEIPLGLDWLKFVGTVYGGIAVDSLQPQEIGTKLSNIDENRNNQYAEWAAALQAKVATDLFVTLGGGTGFPNLTAVGTPAPRVFLGLSYTPIAADRDGDGIPDEIDQCPDQPEDKDGFEDQDGCPDPDNDQDGVFDIDDKCPMDPGPLANQGCPWGDRDNDGVLDNVDDCPDQPGKPENNGCPEFDRDGDGIPDSKDKCPTEPEDFDGFKDDDGCPDPDNDQDGILDVNDECPNEYGVAENKGCPVRDRDGDGIPDDVDKCPDEPETINGIDDDDGCPDKGKTKVRITKTKIEILEKVFFATGKSKIRSRSFNLLDQVASVLKNNKQITQVRIEGHTDSVGSDSSNMKLSQDRADAVRKYLIDAGVSPSRLVARGYGEEQPIDTNKTRAGRERNRRVEFTITEVNGRPVDTNTVTIQEEEVISN